MQRGFIEFKKAISKIGEALLGIAPEPMPRKPNRGVKSFIFNVPEAPSSDSSPDQFPASTDLVLIDELAKGDESSE